MKIKKLLPLLFLPCLFTACGEDVLEERGEIPRVLVETDITVDDSDEGEARMKAYDSVKAFLDDKTALVENTTDSLAGVAHGNYEVGTRAVGDTLEYVFTLTSQGMALYDDQDAMARDLEQSLNELETEFRQLTTALRKAVNNNEAKVAAVYEYPEGEEIVRRDYE